MPAVALGALVASLLLGLLVPIYTDEVGWRFQLARAPFDGGVDRFIAEACGPNTLARAPQFMQPVRFASAHLNAFFADPMYVRLLGVTMALAWVALLWRLVGLVSDSPRARRDLRVLALALLGLGVLPFQLVWSRPEQQLLVALSLGLWIALRHRDGPESEGRRGIWLRVSALVTLGAIVLSYHPKGVALLPVFWVCMFFASRGRDGRLPRVVAIGTLLGLAIVALPYWVERFDCPADPVLRARLESENAAAMWFAGKSLGRLAPQIVLAMLPLGYVAPSLPTAKYMSAWLPPLDLPEGVGSLWRVAVLLTWYAVMAAAGLALLVALRSAARSRRLEPRIVLVLALAAMVAVWSGSEINRKAYEAAFCLPIVVLCSVLSLQSVPERGRRLVSVLAAAAFWVSISSQGLLFATYARPLWSIATTPGYISTQRFSYSAWGYRELEPQIRAAGRMCGVDEPDSIRGLVVDDLTYFAYMTSWRPLHRLGVLRVWNGSITDPIAYLRARSSSGIVVGCLYLPLELRARAHRVGPFCCLGPFR